MVSIASLRPHVASIFSRVDFLLHKLFTAMPTFMGGARPTWDWCVIEGLQDTNKAEKPLVSVHETES